MNLAGRFFEFLFFFVFEKACAVRNNENKLALENAPYELDFAQEKNNALSLSKKKKIHSGKVMHFSSSRLNPFVLNAPYLYPLKISENFKVF